MRLDICGVDELRLRWNWAWRGLLNGSGLARRSTDGFQRSWTVHVTTLTTMVELHLRVGQHEVLVHETGRNGRLLDDWRVWLS
jgi:hypothetical protein